MSRKANELEVEVIEAKERKLGEEHPDTLTAKVNLAHTLHSTDGTDEAMNLMNLCAITSPLTLGCEHPDTLDRFRKAEEGKRRAIRSPTGILRMRTPVIVIGIRAQPCGGCE